MKTQSGPFGWLTPSVAAISNADPEFWRHALGMARSELHWLGLLLSHCDFESWTEEDWRVFSQAARFAARRETAQRFAPAVSHGVIKLIPKLRGDLWRAASYRRLVALYAEPHARKWLSHARTISRRNLTVLAHLPTAYRVDPVIRAAKRYGDLGELLYTVAVAHRARPDLSDRLVVRMIEQKGSGFDIAEFREVLLRQARFPAPPWPGDDRLKPITCYGDLERAARKLRNCLRSYLYSILERECAVYVYWHDNRPVGVVEIHSDAAFGWRLDQALGPDNRELGAPAYTDILQRLNGAGISAGWNELTRIRPDRLVS